MRGRVAVFVDGDNISVDHADAIRRIATQMGCPDILRVYGNASLLPGWQAACGYRLIHSGTGKNATDLLLAIKAIELVLSSSFNIVLIPSSDGDFTRLALRLRERGLHVIGVGEAEAPAMFRGACTSFDLGPPAPRGGSAERRVSPSSRGPADMLNYLHGGETLRQSMEIRVDVTRPTPRAPFLPLSSRWRPYPRPAAPPPLRASDRPCSAPGAAARHDGDRRSTSAALLPSPSWPQRQIKPGAWAGR